MCPWVISLWFHVVGNDVTFKILEVTLVMCLFAFAGAGVGGWMELSFLFNRL